VDALLYSTGRRLSGWARDVLEEVPAPLHLELAPDLMDKLSDKEDGSEIIAIVKIPRIGLSRITPGRDGIVVVLDRPGNPGNLGSTIRSCDAFGCSGIVIFGHAVDLFDPQVIRASAGAFFSVPVARVSDRAALDGWLGGLEKADPRTRLVGTSAKASRLVCECDLRGPVVLCFGNETLGLSAWLKERCHELAGMRMRGAATSLNLACAVTAVLYEAARQKEPWQKEPRPAGSAEVDAEGA
jgi:tRNA G18 (ribose-2'-O)-methylase SpoU